MRQLWMVLLLAGCSSGMITVDQIRPTRFGKATVSAISTDANRRLVIVKLGSAYDDPACAEEGVRTQRCWSRDLWMPKFCAEPPPDAVKEFAEALKVALEAQYAGAGGQIEFNNTVVEVARQLFRRSQGVQLFRDGAFYLCQAWLNGLVDSGSFEKHWGHLLQVAADLAESEIAVGVPAGDEAPASPISDLLPDILR